MPGIRFRTTVGCNSQLQTEIMTIQRRNAQKMQMEGGGLMIVNKFVSLVATRMARTAPRELWASNGFRGKETITLCPWSR